MVRKGLSLLLACVLMFSLTACWDHVELTDMLMVAGIGLDVDGEGDKFHATVEIINIGRGGEENTKSAIVEGRGPTIYEAIQAATVMTGGVMFSNHCKVIVLGDKLARRGIAEVVDIVLRSPNLRKTVDILVAKDATANSILTQKTVKSDIISFELGKILESNVKTLNNACKARAYQLHEALLSDWPFPVISAVSAKENNGEEALQIEGAGIFQGDRLTGFLSGEQCKLLRILTNTADKPVITMQDDRLSPVSFDVRLTKTHVSRAPHVKGDRPSLQVRVNTEAVLEGAAVLTADLNDGNKLREMESVIEDRLSRKLQSLITYVQSEYAADIFAFHGPFERSYRREWDEWRADWPSHFETLDVSVSADARLTGSGLTGNFKPSGKGDKDNMNKNALP